MRFIYVTRIRYVGLLSIALPLYGQEQKQVQMPTVAPAVTAGATTAPVPVTGAQQAVVPSAQPVPTAPVQPSPVTAPVVTQPQAPQKPQEQPPVTKKEEPQGQKPGAEQPKGMPPVQQPLPSPMVQPAVVGGPGAPTMQAPAKPQEPAGAKKEEIKTPQQPVAQKQQGPQEQKTAQPPVTSLVPAAPTMPATPTAIAPAVTPSATPAEEKEPAVALDQDAAFDTMNLEEPEGNWLIKRIWWEKAEYKYEKIKSLVDQILESRMGFFSKRNEVENKILAPFYLESSLNQGQLEEVSSFLVHELKTEQDKLKSLTPQERELQELLISEQRSLEQVKLDIEAIRKLEIALDDALTKLLEQMNLCRNYEKQAWNAFKDIAKVLDHNKARALYYSMDTYLTNVKNVNNYIQQPFTQHFNTLVDTIKQQVERIKKTLLALKEKGIDFKIQAQKLAEQECALEHPEKPQPAPAKEEEEEKPKPQGFIATTWASVSRFFSDLWAALTFWWPW